MAKKVRVHSDGEKKSGGAAWRPTAEADSRAGKLRLIAGVLWLLAIGLEVYGIFGLLLNDGILETDTSVSDDGTVTAGESFPDWAFWVLIGLLVVMAILTIIGSQLWKKAQELDPPSEKNPVSFFLKSQLGAIIPLIAFVPIIVFIFLNKNMSKQQKGWAGGVGIVLGIIAVALGVNYDPPSQEEYTADQQAVIQLLGEDKVYWAGGGEVYHVCDERLGPRREATTSSPARPRRRSRTASRAPDSQDRVGAEHVRPGSAQQHRRDRGLASAPSATASVRAGPAVARLERRRRGPVRRRARRAPGRHR